jgi:dihydrofolate reductase
MGKVMSGLTMSLDGFIAAPNDGPENPLGEGGMRLFDWYSSGDTEYVVPSGGMAFMVSKQSADLLRETFSSIGAIVTGRRTFDITNGWGGKHPLDAPVFVLTHSVPEGWDYEGSPFTFVTDGVESAVEKAKAVAGDKDVAVGAASLAQQCLRAGILDEVHVDLVPVLLGGGVRFFDDLGEQIELERTRLIEAPDVTHITFRVV